MAIDVEILKDTVLFHGMDKDEIQKSLSAFHAHERSYRKNDYILHAGSVIDTLCLVISGNVTIESNDIWGNRTILSKVGPSQFFAETYAMLPNEPLQVDVRANENCRILFLGVGSLSAFQSNSKTWEAKIIRNILMISLHKNLHLSERSFHTSPKTIRERVMAYLNSVALRTGSNEFDIPFDRQQFADYLNLERTALSKELSKMQHDGIIQTRKNHFVLLAKP